MSQPVPESATLPYAKIPTAGGHPDREKLRSQHHLIPVSKDDEGVSWSKISNGVYGFTFTPANEDGGLFSRESFLSFEFQKLADGTLQFVGYTTSENAEKLESTAAPEVEIFPVPKDEFNVLVVIPKVRIAASKPLDRENSNKLKLSLRVS